MNQLSNSRDHEIISKINTYPVLSVGGHVPPLPRRWMNVLIGVALPAGVLFYVRSVFFRDRLKNDFKQIIKTNKEIQNIIYERKF